MSEHNWSCAFEAYDNVELEVVTDHSNMTEPPDGLIISRSADHSVDIDANEEFFVVLKVDGQIVARILSYFSG